MSDVRKALAGGFSGAGGDGGAQTPLDRLIDLMYARAGGNHPIYALHYHEDRFSNFLSIDLKVEACKKILRDYTQPESMSNRHAEGLIMVMEDHPDGYLAMALDDLKINDLREWLKPRTMSHGVIPVFFGARPQYPQG